MNSELRYWRDKFVATLASYYSARESQNILKLVLNTLDLPSETTFILSREKVLSPLQEELLNQFLSEAASGKPVQYILGSCFFDGMKLEVGPGVLIPRPETEELVHWIKSEHPAGSLQSICDLGTGSGCIILSLARYYPEAKCLGVDLSQDALDIASRNKSNLELDNVILTYGDMLGSCLPENGLFDLMVSNPPYVPLSERSSLSPIVADEEPALALFTPGDDPLLFYRKIADLSLRHLNPGGHLYLELHEKYASETAEIFEALSQGSVEVKTDLQGKSRMLRYAKPL